MRDIERLAVRTGKTTKKKKTKLSPPTEAHKAHPMFFIPLSIADLSAVSLSFLRLT